MRIIGCQPVERWRWQGQDVSGRISKTWKECVDDDMKVLGLHGIQGCVEELHMGK